MALGELWTSKSGYCYSDHDWFSWTQNAQLQSVGRFSNETVHNHNSIHISSQTSFIFEPRFHRVLDFYYRSSYLLEDTNKKQITTENMHSKFDSLWLSRQTTWSVVCLMSCTSVRNFVYRWRERTSVHYPFFFTNTVNCVKRFSPSWLVYRPKLLCVQRIRFHKSNYCKSNTQTVWLWRYQFTAVQKIFIRKGLDRHSLWRNSPNLALNW